MLHFSTWRPIYGGSFYTSILIFTSFLLLSESSAVDTSANIAIKDGDTIVSNGANRETPITDKSGIFKLSDNGRLLIINGRNAEIWSSSNSMVSAKNLNPVMQLFDNGNLVVWDNEKGSTIRNLIWQSFNYPGNTLLPGMKLGKDFVTGIDTYLTSWKSSDDPSPGLHMYSIDTNGYPQTFGRLGSVLRMRIGPWNGVKFRGSPMDELNRIYSQEFIVNQNEIYFKYELTSSVVLRVVLTSDGNTEQFQLMHVVVTGFCGPYGSCSINRYPPCSCIEGFVPTTNTPRSIKHRRLVDRV